MEMFKLLRHFIAFNFLYFCNDVYLHPISDYVNIQVQKVFDINFV